MADNSEETVDKSGVKIVVTEVSVEGEQADDDDVNIKSADQSLDMSHDTSGPIADPDISVQFDESIDNMGDVSAEQEQFEDAAESLKLDLSDDKNGRAQHEDSYSSSSSLEEVIARLEDSVLKDKDTEDYTVRGEGDSPSKIPARIREIITKNLASDDKGLRLASMSTPTPQQLQEENRLLSTELNRVEDLLAASRAERDELGIKYNALSEKVLSLDGSVAANSENLEQSLRGDSLDASDSTSKPLLQQKH
ncbi:rootletin-like isoform X3 [Ruditapes philippinarum]|uniref:rootletin-like isoform X3 n=1 Tax=Ruditapes philippinarum TaxID=129788 RepID=UPI00295C088E|nr:rootletin-like isoform X3 [Ruditapes philippinarum]